jgi:hypothetical protein
MQRSVEIRGQARGARGGRGRGGAYHQQRTGGDSVQAVAHQMAQPAAHLIAHHRGSHGARHDKADPAFRTTHLIGVQVQNKTAPSGAPATAHRQSELVTVAQAVRGAQHGAVRPRASRDPWLAVR